MANLDLSSAFNFGSLVSGGMNIATILAGVFLVIGIWFIFKIKPSPLRKFKVLIFDNDENYWAGSYPAKIKKDKKTGTRYLWIPRLKVETPIPVPEKMGAKPFLILQRVNNDKYYPLRVHTKIETQNGVESIIGGQDFDWEEWYSQQVMAKAEKYKHQTLLERLQPFMIMALGLIAAVVIYIVNKT